MVTIDPSTYWLSRVAAHSWCLHSCDVLCFIHAHQEQSLSVLTTSPCVFYSTVCCSAVQEVFVAFNVIRKPTDCVNSYLATIVSVKTQSFDHMVNVASSLGSLVGKGWGTNVNASKNRDHVCVNTTLSRSRLECMYSCMGFDNCASFDPHKQICGDLLGNYLVYI